MALAAATLAGVLCPTLASAQAVQGSVLDRAGRPVPGVVLLLLDAEGRESGRALTNERGEYRVAAAADGSYRLRALRIGFRPSTSEPLQLSSASAVSRTVTLGDVVSALDTITVRGRNACRVRPDSAVATFAIWEQVRAALLAAEVTVTTERLMTRAVSYRRSLHPDNGRVLRQALAVSTGRSAQVWNSVPPDSLRRSGYIVTDISGVTSFNAPDLAVLLSDAFVEDHCFRIDPRSDASRVGIAFEPTRERRAYPEIRGTMWVDRRSSELRLLEFAYVNLSRELEAQEPGGSMSFARLPDGTWVILRWSIRMPVVETERITGTRTGFETRLRETRVHGGELALAMRGQDTLWSRPPVVASGRIVDDRTGNGIAGAWIALAGTALTAVSDDTGAFRIANALPGDYVVNVRTPSLDSLGADHTDAWTFTDPNALFLVRVPAADALIPRLCGRPGTDGPGRIVTGSVGRAGDSLPAYNVKVVAAWGGPSQASQWREVRSDATGQFRFCGLPMNTDLVVRAEDDSARVARREMRFTPSQRFGLVELIMERRPADAAVFTGATLSDVAGQPLSDVEVALPELSKNTFTNERGAFRIEGIPAGSHEIAVRRVGFRQVVMTIAFSPGQTVERQILLSRIAVLDTVSVRATPRDKQMEDFWDNRRVGLGKFWTRDELAKLEGYSVSSIMSQINGTRIIRGKLNYAWIVRSRGVLSLGGTDASTISPDEFDGARGAPKACYATVWVDGVNVYRGKSGEPLFNLNSLQPDQIEAMEYYANPAQTPGRYSNLNTICGTFVLWTRRTPDKKPDE